MVGSIQQQPQQQQQQQSTPASTPVGLTPPQQLPPPSKAAAIRVLRGSSPLRSPSVAATTQTLSTIQTKVPSEHQHVNERRDEGVSEEWRKQFETKIYENIKQHDKNIYNKIKDEIFGMFDVFSKQVLKDTKDIKEQVLKDHLPTGTQISCLRDEIQMNFASLRVEMNEIIKNLREDLWYQCDHMKFINLIDSKFKQFESEFDQHISEPNHVKFEKEFGDKSEDSETNTKVSDEILNKTEEFDEIDELLNEEGVIPLCL